MGLMMSSGQLDRVAIVPQPNTSHPHSPALQLIYDTAPIGLAFLSPDCRYLHINQHLTEICGISVADHIGRRVRDTVPALAEAVENIVASIMQTGEPVIGVEVAGQRPDEAGERTWVTYWHPLRGPDGKISGVNVAAEEITHRKRAEEELRRREEHIEIILGELAHRTKNLLVVVMALAKQTARNATDVKHYQAVFTQRLQGLAHSHDLLLSGHWQGASFADLVAMQMQPFREENDERIRATGPAIMLVPDAVQNLGLVFHELATNASKHGALSVPEGVVSIEWSAPGAGERIAVQWQESGGPPVQPPQRRGFGHELIERIVPQVLKGTGGLNFAPSGVSWSFEFPAAK
jgi:PAS domain S-box-containing protein